LKFHVDNDHLPSLIEALKASGQRLSHRDNFLGFMALDLDLVRHEITVISLWDGNGVADTERVFESARAEIALTADLGMRRSICEVITFVPGASEEPAIHAGALRSARHTRVSGPDRQSQFVATSPNGTS
jgi:hypothetical protein